MVRRWYLQIDKRKNSEAMNNKNQDNSSRKEEEEDGRRITFMIAGKEYWYTWEEWKALQEHQGKIEGRPKDAKKRQDR